MKYLAALFLAVLFSFSASGAEVICYVTTSGSDANTGLTPASPFATPQKAAAFMSAGSATTALIGPGTYTSSSTVQLTRSGTPTTPMVFCAVNSNTFPPDVRFVNTSFDCFQSIECSNVVVRNIRMSGLISGARRAIDLQCYNAMYSNLTVDHCELDNFGYGIFAETTSRGCVGVNFLSNYVHDCQLSGIYSRGDSTFHRQYRWMNITLNGNTVSNITGDATHELGSGILINGFSNAVVTRNFVIKCGASASNTGGGPGGIILSAGSYGYAGWNCVGEIRRTTGSGIDGVGINPGPEADNCMFEHNYVWNCDGAGYLENIQNGTSFTNTCRWNVIVNCGLLNQTPIRIVGFQSTPPITSRIHNNTIVTLKDSVIPVFFDVSTQGPEYFANNLVISTNAAMIWVNGATPFWRLNGNMYTNLASATVTYNQNGTIRTGLAAWQSGTSQDANSLQIPNPLRNAGVVIAPTNVDQMKFITNYWPVAGSTVLSSGRNLQQDYGFSPGSIDAVSNTVSGAIPIGAYASAVTLDPFITQQPQSVAVYINQSTNFTVVASGTPTLHYQWKVNGANQGTDSATFTTNTVLAGANGATVSVVVTGPGANSPVTSANAIIQVLPDPYITGQPQNVTTSEGGSATFTVVAQGATTLSYAWTVGGVSQGGNSATLVLNNVPFLFNGSAVICAVTDSNGTTNSASATLTVNHNGPPPPYTGDPVNFTLVSAMRTNLTDVIQGWIPYDVSYYPGITELNTNFDTGRAAGQIAWFTFPLPAILSPQRYKIVGGFATQDSGGGKIIVNAGDGWITNTFPLNLVNTWTNIGDVLSSISFSNITVGFVKIPSAGTLQNYWIAGIGALQTNWDTIIAGTYRYIDTNAITSTNLVGAPGNLIPNSSFEFGLAPGGWTSSRNGTIGNETWLSNMTTNDAFNGSKAAVIGDGLNASRFQIISPPLWLRGDRNIRSYVLSFYHKKGPGGPGSATVGWSRPYSGNDTGSATFTPSGSWTRFQTNLWLSPYPNRLFQFEIHHVASGPLQIDAVQFEESTNGATAYAPADQVEIALSCRKISDPNLTWRNGNVINSLDNTPSFGIQVYNNTASSSNLNGHIEIFDWLNRNAGAGTFSSTAPPGISDFPVTTSFRGGASRIYAYVDGSPSFRSEAEFCNVPTPNLTTTNWNSIFGSHACQENTLLASNLAWGISWQRGLSPGGIVQMSEIEASDGVFTYTSTDAKINAALAGNKSVVLANLSDVSDLPSWVLTNGIPRLDKWSNFVYITVLRYSGQIHHWEAINEPMTPSGWSAATYATIETATAGAVKAADPTAKYVGAGGIGAGTDISGYETAWSALTPTTKSQIDYVAVHMYPANVGLWMGADDDPRPAAAAALGIFTGKPIWNTESGVYHWSNHGDKNGGLQGVPSYANHNEELEYRKTVYQTAELAARNWIRLLGYGVQKYFYYDGRVAGGSYANENTLPQWFSFDDSIGPIGAAYFWSVYFLDYPSYVQSMTNTATSDVFGALFAHTNGNAQAIAAFTLSRSNLVMTVTNSSFAVFDMMGNLLQTNTASVAIGRTPTYWVSSDLTSNQLVATFQNASVTASANTVAPSVSIDVSQHGNVLETNQLPFRFRWTAISPYDINTDDTPLIVLTRSRFSGITDWTEWTADRYVEMTNAPSILTHLEVQAKDVEGNLSGTFVGPDFGPSGVGPIAPYNFHISKGHVSSGHL